MRKWTLPLDSAWSITPRNIWLCDSSCRSCASCLAAPLKHGMRKWTFPLDSVWSITPRKIRLCDSSCKSCASSLAAPLKHGMRKWTLPLDSPGRITPGKLYPEVNITSETHILSLVTKAQHYNNYFILALKIYYWLWKYFPEVNLISHTGLTSRKVLQGILKFGVWI